MLGNREYLKPKMETCALECIKPGSFASIRFPYVTSTLYEVPCLLQYYFLFSTNAPFVGASAKPWELGLRKGFGSCCTTSVRCIMLWDFQHILPCSIASCKAVLGTVFTLERHYSAKKKVPSFAALVKAFFSRQERGYAHCVHGILHYLGGWASV